MLTLTGSASTIADYQTALELDHLQLQPGQRRSDRRQRHQPHHRLVGQRRRRELSNTGTSTLDTVHVAPTVTAGGTVDLHRRRRRGDRSTPR